MPTFTDQVLAVRKNLTRLKQTVVEFKIFKNET